MNVTPESIDATHGEPARQTHIVYSVMHFLRIVRHRKGVVMACVFISGALGALYYATTTRFYESSAGILVMQTGNDVNGTQITPEGSRGGLMPTYERIIRGSEVLEGAAKRLPAEHRIDLEDADPKKWAKIIRNQLSVATVRNSNVIEVTYRSRSAESAAAVVQAIVDSYLEYMRQTSGGAAADILHVLSTKEADTTRRLNQKRQEVLQARQQLLDIGHRSEGGPLHPAVQRAVVLNDALSAQTQKRIALQAQLSSIQQTIRNGGDLNQHMMSLEGEIGRELMMARLGIGNQDAGSRERLEQQLIRDRAALQSRLQSGYGEEHFAVKEIANRIGETQQYLNTYQQRVNEQIAKLDLGAILVNIVEQTLAGTIRHENALAQQYAHAESEAIALLGKSRHLETLEQDERFLQQLLNGYLEKIARVDLGQDQGIIRTKVTDQPKVISAAVWPRLPIVGLASLALGLVVGVAIVSVLDVLDDRFRSPEELQEQLRLPVLAMVRKLTIGAETGLDGLQMHVAPDAPESEAFRTLRTAIAFSGQDAGRIVVSSSEPGDGKTTVLSNLGVAYARSGKRTLLIDADMRKPGLTKLMEMRGCRGLTQLLQGDEPVAELAASLVRPTGVERLDIIPSGPRQANPAELLSGARLPELLAWAESTYDQIVIDAPPAVAAADAAIIGAIADGLVLVVRPEKNKRQDVVRAVDSFRGFGVTPLGLVVNGLGTESQAFYNYSDGYGYGEISDDLHPATFAAHEDAHSDAGLDIASPTDGPAPIIPRRAA